MSRNYWLLIHNSLTDHDLIGFTKIMHGSILEQSMDGEISLWPVKPHTLQSGTHELCEVCMRFLSTHVYPNTSEFIIGCKANAEEGRPCAFEAVPEVLDHQDFDNLLIDGSPTISESGCASPGAFFHSHGIDQKAFTTIPLGVYSNIRECRESLSYCYD